MKFFLKQLFRLVLISVYVILFIVACKAQQVDNWLPGTLITTENDTMVGLIEDNIEGKNVLQYRFKNIEDSTPKEVEKAIVKHIYFQNGVRYDRIQSTNGYELANAIVTGEVSLYKQFRSSSKTYFLLEKGRTVILKDKEQSTISMSDLDLNTIDIVVVDRTRLETSLDTLYNQCTTERPYKFKLKDGFLKQEVIKLNDCLQTNYKLHPRKRYVHQISLLGGRSLFNERSLNGFTAFGIHYSRVNLRYKKKSSFLVNLHYLLRTRFLQKSRFLALSAAWKYKFTYGIVQPYFYLGVGGLYNFNPEFNDNKISVIPINLGLGFDVPINRDLAIQADISFSSALTSTIGVAYYIRNLR